MAIQKLSARQVQTAAPGKYNDGLGLWLEVKPNGARRWFFRCTIDGKRREPGIGPYPDTTLAQARKRAAALRALVAQGLDPLNLPPAPEAVIIPTFTQAAARFIRGHRQGWSNPKHARQWASTLRVYAKPLLGALPVDQIDTPHILAVLTPIWQKKTETAKRVQGRIENILDWAIAHKYRTGPNPAAWRGNLDKILARPAKVAASRHQPAMPWPEVPAFIKALAASDSISSLALQFLIRTAARTQEVLLAQWPEIDLDARLWRVPAERMKARRAHEVPLTDATLAILAKLPRLADTPFIFPGARHGRPLASMALLMAMRKRGHGVGGTRSDSVPHGFRSSFRDWAGETTPHPRDIVEEALAHAIPNATERAYRRGHMLDKRRLLMADWDAFLDRPAAQVIPLHPRALAAATA
ncbi:MAG: integrase arm-type DNA-binding domain-containing protein [Chromatiaceae bacterium]|nr:integrase arm-type DNA-binding domain-containing protein [Chromatiaceae bacterium]